jgi:hypothetical protein
MTLCNYDAYLCIEMDDYLGITPWAVELRRRLEWSNCVAGRRSWAPTLRGSLRGIEAQIGGRGTHLRRQVFVNRRLRIPDDAA